MNKNDTWKLVQEKQAELRRLTEQNWKSGEYELAVLGEKTLRTVEQSSAAVNDLRRAMLGLHFQCRRLESVPSK